MSKPETRVAAAVAAATAVETLDLMTAKLLESVREARH